MSDYKLCPRHGRMMCQECRQAPSAPGDTAPRGAEHVCGLQGYQRGAIPDPICPACAPASPVQAEPPEALKDERIYPCAKCGFKMTVAEGGKVFAVCEDCWDQDFPTTGRPRGRNLCAKLEAEHAALREALSGIITLDVWKYICDVPGCCDDVYKAIEAAHAALARTEPKV